MWKSEPALAYQFAVAAAARRAMRGREPFEGEVEVRLLFAFATRRNDVDGPIKSTLDAVALGGVVANDRQVTALKVRKVCDPEAPRTEVEVVETGGA
jgi:Holliday junction resolvase RusA-like endonuclease